MSAKVSLQPLKEVCESFIALDTKSRHNILSYMLIEVNQEYMSFKATNLENFVFASIPCQSQRHFSILVDIKEFSRLIKELKVKDGDIVEIDLVNFVEVIIKHNKKEFVLIGNENIQNFPDFPRHTFSFANFRLKTDYFEIAQNLFDSVIEKDIDPPILKYIHFKFLKSGIKFEATNRYTLTDLALYQPTRFKDLNENLHLYGNIGFIIFSDPERIEALIYPSLFKIGSKLFKNDDYVCLYVSDKYMLVSNEKRFDRIRYIITPLIDERYPDTDNLIPSIPLGMIFFNKDVLIDTLLKLRKKNKIALKIISNQVSISEVGEETEKNHSEPITCEVIGGEFCFTTRFKVKELLAFLKSTNEKIVKFEIFKRDEKSGIVVASPYKGNNEQIRLISVLINA
jgi:DNA polymerase III sliding clamp (beta) subunit (PCNA family)